MIQNLSKRF